jgi:hypothetical protein
LCFVEILEMSKSDEQLERKNSGRRQSGSKGQGGGREYTHRFVNLDFTPDTKATFKSLLADGEFANSTVDEFLRSGYSVKFSSADSGKTVVCTVTCSIEGDPNNGLMLTGRGGDATTALAVALYKDTYLCENGAWASGEDAARARGDNIA